MSSSDLTYEYCLVPASRLGMESVLYKRRERETDCAITQIVKKENQNSVYFLNNGVSFLLKVVKNLSKSQ